MAIHWSMESHNNILIVMAVYDQEAPNFQMWHQAIQEIIQDERYHPGMGFILDRRSVSEIASTQDVRDALDYIKDHLQFFRGSRWGVLQSNPVSYGMARMGQILSMDFPIEVEIFNDPDHAKAWLVSQGSPAV